jgi:soluble lytic murein transglycosylase
VRTFVRLGLLALCFVLSGAGEARHVEAAPESNPTESGLPLPGITLPRDSPESRAVAALAHAREPSLGRLRWLVAKATPDIAQARVPLEALAQSDHPLATWARLRLTERLRDRDPSAAADSADQLLVIEPRFRARAEQLLSLSLYAAGRTVEAEPLLRALVGEAPERSSAAVFALPLANILAAKSDPAAQRQALSLYRRVLTRAPLAPTAEVARSAVQALLARFPTEERKALSPLSADEAFAEADALFDGRDYTRAAQRYAALVERFHGDPQSVCDAWLGQGKAFFSLNKRNEALALFETAADSCTGAEVRANAHFQAGRILLRRGEPAPAIAHYDKVASEYPGHRVADDSLLAAATAFQDLGDGAAARVRLKQLLDGPAQSDTRPDARFMLAWIERSDHHFDAALAEFSQLLAEGPGERGEDLVGRASYWRARTLLDLGRRDEAKAGWVELINAHPLTYYAQQALARLGELDAKAAAQLIAALRDEVKHKNVRLSSRPELQKPEFMRAVELLRVGETSPAMDELDALGCFQPKSDDDLYLMAASLLQEFGAERDSLQLARKRVARVMSQAPRGDALILWRIIFPRAFRPLIEDVATRAQIPPAFVRAIAREESSFDPNAVSSANAYGLIQLIRPTARAFGKPLGLRSDPASLKKPEVNLRIGVNFMRFLFDRYKQNAAIVPAAYNAGSGAVDRWLRQRGQLSLDEWIETIPYTETRRYTRRVLQSYGAYAWLDEGRVPALPLALPHLQP